MALGKAYGLERPESRKSLAVRGGGPRAAAAGAVTAEAALKSARGSRTATQPERNAMASMRTLRDRSTVQIACLEAAENLEPGIHESS